MSVVWTLSRWVSWRNQYLLIAQRGRLLSFWLWPLHSIRKLWPELWTLCWCCSLLSCRKTESLGSGKKKKLHSIYVKWFRRIWNSRLADSSVARITFVVSSIPIKTWICPGLLAKYFKSWSNCDNFSLTNKFCVIPEKEKKKRNKHKKSKIETLKLSFFSQTQDSPYVLGSLS